MIQLILLHVIFSTSLGLFFGWIYGHITSEVAFWSLVLGTLLARFFTPYKHSFELIEKKRTYLDKAALAIVIGLIIHQAVFLFFYKDRGWFTLNPHNFGDLPWHLSIIRYIGRGGEIWPFNPIFAQDLIRYPFAIDLYNGLWESFGISTLQHLPATMAVLLIAISVWIYRWLGWIGLVGIFLSGGWYGWQFITGGVVDPWMKDIDWKNALLALWVPQRSFLIGLPLGLIMIRQAIDGTVFRGIRGAILQPLLWGLFPFFHAHAFVVTAMITLVISIFKHRFLRQIIVFFAAAPLAIFFVYILTDGFARSSVTRFVAGWQLQGKDPISFWWFNLGPWFTLWIVSIIAVLFIKRFKTHRMLVFASSFFFLLFNFLILAPWEWDNFKLLIWPYILFVIAMSYIAEDYWAFDSWLVRFEKILFALVLSFSGLATNLVIVSQNSSRIYEANEVYELESCLKEIQRESVFAAYPTYNHVLGFLGFKLVLGYPGHLWSHGINYHETEQSLNNVMRGGAGWRDDLTKIKATHIFWGHREKTNFGEGYREWMNEFERIQCRSVNSNEMDVYVVR